MKSQFIWNGNQATLVNGPRKVGLNFKNPDYSHNGFGITINNDFNSNVALTIEEACHLRDYLNSIIPKGA